MNVFLFANFKDNFSLGLNKICGIKILFPSNWVEMYAKWSHYNKQLNKILTWKMQ